MASSRRASTFSGGAFTAPKTVKSRRTVRLKESAQEALWKHLERQLGEIDKAGPLWKESGLTFATERGTPLNRHNLSLSALL